MAFFRTALLLGTTLSFASGVPALAQRTVPAAPDAIVYKTALTTKWGREVTPENAWRSYPRPQRVRDRWLNLNGQWDYAIAKAGTPRPAQMQGKILVPFAVESKLSGVQRPVLPDDRIWYRRSFAVPADWAGQHVLLNFGAVDYEAAVWVNGAYVGAHKGGSATFSFDITAHLRSGDNELVVQVADPTSDGVQPRGKQTLAPQGIWYTPVSGIWQTVWLEPVNGGAKPGQRGGVKAGHLRRALTI
ncbi:MULTISPECIES: sugar-binding domain-containing protein [Sphingomonas]|uniref:Sugar-binding domain-containing protein n=1 Tax=Sphingomonas molluscorum TaxID=418184 RepID=A0ABU8Q695_9SPHN|nr:sugar-binding domain-containing protein [Sphingomonas sp. JUb134]MBM7406577.1 hypothetical protein [Sphingomonas sp. JUb134]